MPSSCYRSPWIISFSNERRPSWYHTLTSSLIHLQTPFLISRHKPTTAAPASKLKKTQSKMHAKPRRYPRRKAKEMKNKNKKQKNKKKKKETKKRKKKLRLNKAQGYFVHIHSLLPSIPYPMLPSTGETALRLPSGFCTGSYTSPAPMFPIRQFPEIKRCRLKQGIVQQV